MNSMYALHCKIESASRYDISRDNTYSFRQIVERFARSDWSHPTFHGQILHFQVLNYRQICWEALNDLLGLGIFVIHSDLDLREGVEDVKLRKIDLSITVYGC